MRVLVNKFNYQALFAPASQRRLLLAGLWLAFGLRVWALDFGLPYEFHPDEHQYVDAVLNWYANDTLSLSYINPPMFTYLLVITFWGWLSFTEITVSNLVVIYTVARFHSAAFAVLTVALMYPLARRLGGHRAGVLAVWLLAGAFLPVREAHFAVNDTAAAFFVLLALYLSVGLLKPGGDTVWHYSRVGIAVGVATATKLTGGVVALAMVLAHLLARPRTHHLLGVGIGSAGLTFALITWHWLRDIPGFVAALGEHLQFGRDGYKGLQMAPASGWQFYVETLAWGLGWSLLGAVGMGLLWTAVRRNRMAWLVAVVPLVLFLYMGSQKILFARFILPAIPPLLVLAAAALADWGGARRGWIWALIVVGLLAQPVATSLRFNGLLGLPDTRELATDWLTDQLAPDAVIVQESYATFPGIYFFEQRWPYKIIQLDERGPHRNAANFYLRHKTDYIVRSEFTAGRARSNSEAEQARQTQAAQLRENATLVKRFNPYAGEYDGWFYLDKLFGPAGDTWQRIGPGPIIEIYALPYENQPRQFEIPPVAYPVAANFANQLILLGYDLPQRRAMPGDSLPITLYWQAVQKMETVYVNFTRLLDNQQIRRGGYDRWPRETAKTTLWHPGEVVVDTFSLPIDSTTPPGIYTIDLGIYAQDDDTATSLPLVSAGEALDQRSIRTLPVKIGGPPPEAVLSPEQFTPQYSQAITLGEVIRLHGYDFTRTSETISLTLYWESLARTPRNWSIFAHLRDASNQTVTQQDALAGGTGSVSYPSALWDAGDLIRDTLVMPARVPAGEYRLVVGLYSLEDGQRLTSDLAPNGEIVLHTWLE